MPKAENEMTLEEFAARGHRAVGAVQGVLAAQTTKPWMAAAGRTAQASGKDFEKSLEITHAAYHAAGIALIQRLPVNTQPMPRNWLRTPEKHGGMARLLAEKQAADYYGTLANGRSVLMEAKSSTKRQASLKIVGLGQGGGGLKTTQLQGLAGAGKMGALVAVVWKNGEERLILNSEALQECWYKHRLGEMQRIHRDRFSVYTLSQVSGIEAENWLTPLITA